MNRTPLRHVRSAALVGPAAALLVVGMAVPAQAAVSVVGSSVYGDGADDFINVTCSGGVLTAGAATGDPCATLTSIYVSPGDGADSVFLSEVTRAAFPALRSVSVDVEESGIASADSVTGSAVDDTLTGDYLDTLNGGDGNDAITGGRAVSGGLGDDSINEFMGDGTPTGGPGDDRFIQFLSLGGVEGGPGFDSYEIDFDKTAPQLGADLTLELRADTLRVVAGSTDAVLPVGGIELVDFTLLRGDVQTWNGAAFGGMQRVRGMAGVDTLVGGANEDTLWGGSGNDAVTGGAGGDDLRGGDGDDTINARDGVVDRVDCGAGTDAVVADAADALVGCESVDVPAVAPPVAPPVAQVPETSAISGKSKVAKPKTAKFRFSSPTPGATFQCKLDKGKWKTCSSPHKVKTKKLKAGKHKLQVRAVAGGLVDATPSKKTFKVKRG